MSIPTNPGVYLLCSADTFGKRVYKVGRSDNLRQRLGGYPPNFTILGLFPCENPGKLEEKLIQSFRSKFKIYARQEYFESPEELSVITKTFNDVISGESVVRKRKTEKSPLDDLREYVLETHGGVITKEDVYKCSSAFNKMINRIIKKDFEGIVSRETIREETEEYLKEIIPLKDVQKYITRLAKTDLSLVTKEYNISRAEVAKLYKK